MIITSLLTKFHQSPTSSFWEILLKNKQTNRQTNKHTKVIPISRFSRDKNRLNFSDELSSYQGKSSTWVTFSDNLSPYQRQLFHSSNFPKHFFTFVGDFVPLDRFPQTSCSIGLIKTWFVNSWFSRWNRMIDSSCGISFYGEWSPYDCFLNFQHFSINGI